MTIGPAPMMRIDLMSWRFGMASFRFSRLRKKPARVEGPPAGCASIGIFRLEAAYRQVSRRTEPHKLPNRQESAASIRGGGRRSGSRMEFARSEMRPKKKQGVPL